MSIYKKRMRTPGATLYGHLANKDGSMNGVAPVPARKLFLAGFYAALRYYRQHPEQLSAEKRNATKRSHSDGEQ